MFVNNELVCSVISNQSQNGCHSVTFPGNDGISNHIHFLLLSFLTSGHRESVKKTFCFLVRVSMIAGSSAVLISSFRIFSSVLLISLVTAPLWPRLTFLNFISPGHGTNIWDWVAQHFSIMNHSLDSTCIQFQRMYTI